MLKDTFGETSGKLGTNLQMTQSPLLNEPWKKGEWFPRCYRSGLIGVKIGVLPQYNTNGEMFYTTLVQVYLI